MGSFQITNQGTNLILDTTGNVTSGGAAAGTWTVTKDDQIQITPTAGAAIKVPVTWNFNQANELTLEQGTQNSFNFFGDTDTFPVLFTSKAVLTVQPDSNGNFTFDLHPTWKLEANFDMTITIAGKSSTIDGLLGNREDSGFDYIFTTQDPLAVVCALNFTGTWKQPTNGQADLIFQYDSDTPGSAFDLPPEGLGIDSSKNIFTYTANKNNQTSAIALLGTLTINEDFSLTYEILQQDNAGVTSQTLRIGATLDSPNFGTGSLNIKLNRTAGLPLSVSIAGQFQGSIGSNTKLTVGFSYTRQVQGTVDTTTIAFQGEVKTDKDDFVWAISDTNGTINVSAHVNFVVGNTCEQASLNFKTSQGQVAVTAMFSITTGCKQAQPVAAAGAGGAPAHPASKD